MRKIALVTDTLSTGYYFPTWLKYYSNFIAHHDIYICGYRSAPLDIQSLPSGNIIYIADDYSDEIRAEKISVLVKSLLDSYDTVVRVDTDEFLVPDPVKYTNLGDFLERDFGQLITARGFDVIETTGESKLDLSRPILWQQRKLCYPNNSLNKTCVTRVALEWLPGFHACDHEPRFDDLFLFHLKRADMALQFQWCEHMLTNITADSHAANYYNPSREQIIQYHYGISHRPVIRGPGSLYRNDHIEKYLADVKLDRKYYRSNMDHEPVLVEVGPEMDSLF